MLKKKKKTFTIALSELFTYSKNLPLKEAMALLASRENTALLQAKEVPGERNRQLFQRFLSNSGYQIVKWL